MTTAQASPIGEKYEPFKGEMWDFYAEARRKEPVFWSPEMQMYVVTKYDDRRRGDRAAMPVRPTRR